MATYINMDLKKKCMNEITKEKHDFICIIHKKAKLHYIQVLKPLKTRNDF